MPSSDDCGHEVEPVTASATGAGEGENDAVSPLQDDERLGRNAESSQTPQQEEGELCAAQEGGSGAAGPSPPASPRRRRRNRHSRRKGTSAEVAGPSPPLTAGGGMPAPGCEAKGGAAEASHGGDAEGAAEERGAFGDDAAEVAASGESGYAGEVGTTDEGQFEPSARYDVPGRDSVARLRSWLSLPNVVAFPAAPSPSDVVVLHDVLVDLLPLWPLVRSMDPKLGSRDARLKSWGVHDPALLCDVLFGEKLITLLALDDRGHLAFGVDCSWIRTDIIAAIREAIPEHP